MVRGDVQVEDFLQEFGALAPCLGHQGVAHLATEETPEGDCLGRTQLPVTADAHLEVTQEGQREEGRGAGLGSSARVGAAGAVEASKEEASSGCWGGPEGAHQDALTRTTRWISKLPHILWQQVKISQQLWHCGQHW